MKKIACFITPHGFGHATRMSAVLEALQRQSPDLHPQLYTTVPESLFAETLENFSYFPVYCDIGLIQKDGMHADIPATITRLQKFLPFADSLIKELAIKIKGCSLVLCDISPLGIAVAKEVGIPSVLIENFTWDWIYRAYLPQYPDLQPAIEYLAAQYQHADIHICAEPVCGPDRGQFQCGPIFRNIRQPRKEVRKRLGYGEKKLVLITMGGIDLELSFVPQLSDFKNIIFLLAGQETNRRLADNVLLLSRNSAFYHPDLINAVDCVVCKSGYSSVAECFQAGVPVVTVGRTTFPESPLLEAFCASRLGGERLSQEDFFSGNWLGSLESLLSRQRQSPAGHNGADAIAVYLGSFFGS
jgi:UDP:flavonoid glycosyltransferase YjiC (YdhE family)